VILSAFGKSGYHLESLSDWESFPSSISCRTAVATNVLVIEPMRNLSARSLFSPVSRFALPLATT
jgi:hypothetical protein